MIQSSYKYLTIVIALSFFCSCANSEKVIGEYKQGDRRIPYIIHLDSDNTGYYTWWTDIQMKNNGTWTISNDTLMFKDLSPLRPEDKLFIIKGNKLTDEKGIEYKKLNFFQRKMIYRGR